MNKNLNFKVDMISKSTNSKIGEQVVSLSSEDNIINIGANLNNSSPVCSIVFDSKGEALFKTLKDSELFKSINEKANAIYDNYCYFKVNKTSLIANDDITIELEGLEDKKLGNLIIKSNKIVLEKDKKETLLCNFEDKFMNIELPNNFTDLTKDDNSPITLKSTNSSKKAALPSQMFNIFAEMSKENNNVRILDLNKIGVKNQSLKMVVYGNRIFVADGTKLKEVEAGFKIINDEKNSDKQHLIVKFDKFSGTFGESKNSKLFEGLDKETVSNIKNFLPETLNGSKVVDLDENKTESLQIETIPLIKSSRSLISRITPEYVIEPMETPAAAEDPVQEQPEKPVAVEQAEEQVATEEPAGQTVEEQVNEQEKEQTKPAKEQTDMSNKEQNNKPAKDNSAPAASKDNKVFLPKFVIPGILTLGFAALLLCAIFTPIGVFFLIFAALGLVSSSISLGKAIAQDLQGRATKKAKKKGKTKDKVKNKDKNKDKDKDKDKDKKKTKKKKKDKSKTKEEVKTEEPEQQEEPKEKNESDKQNELCEKIDAENEKINRMISSIKTFSVLNKNAKDPDKKEMAEKGLNAINDLKSYSSNLDNLKASYTQKNLESLHTQYDSINKKYSSVFKYIKNYMNESEKTL